MTISVLLPTRNRLQYLKSAVETVLRQDYADWEIIISDNDSDEDVGGFCKSLNDPRVRYFRTASFLPVTENWNNALDESTGDYVVMLGDDDGLMKGHLSTMERLIREYDAPDLIYTGAFIYAYPGVMPGFPDGYLQRNCNPIFPSNEPFWLDHGHATALVRQSMQLKMPFTFNMQHSVVSRSFIGSLKDKGPFFQSPYPDFYATNVAFLMARRLLIYQRPLVTIGITPRSYGFFHFNKNEKGGMEFLKNAPDPTSAARLSDTVLPGNKNNTSWLFAMSAIEANYGSNTGLRAGYRRYRFLQIVHAFKNYYLDRRFSVAELDEISSAMRVWERVAYGVPMSIAFSAMRMLPRDSLGRLVARLRSRLGQYSGLAAIEQRSDFRTILDVFDAVDPLADCSGG